MKTKRIWRLKNQQNKMLHNFCFEIKMGPNGKMKIKNNNEAQKLSQVHFKHIFWWAVEVRAKEVGGWSKCVAIKKFVFMFMGL